jgi:beta-glucosidase
MCTIINRKPHLKDERMSQDIRNKIKKLTLQEKILLVLGADSWRTHAIQRLGIPSVKMADGPHGARVVFDHMEAENKSMPATVFPTGSAMAATWNPALVSKVTAAMAREAAERGVDILLGPGVNIQRLPHNGRNFEYFSEDPYLSAELAVAYINGMQNEGISACVKHYAANSQEYERMSISSQIDERTLREIYLPAFEAAVKHAKVWMLMCSYNKINGTFASEHNQLLTEILREEWGFDGLVVSDWGAVYNRLPTANAGLDLEMPGPGSTGIKEWEMAIKKHRISKDILNTKAANILQLVERIKTGGKQHAIQPSADQQHPEHIQIARKAAAEAITLLKNEGQLLPIHPDKIKSILIVGPNATEPAIQGSGSSHVTPFYVPTPLDAIKEQFAGKIAIEYAQGCYNTLTIPPLPFHQDTDDQGQEKIGLDAVFYPNPDFNGTPILIRKDNIISFCDDDLKIKELQGKNFSARWQGKYTAPISGKYTFGLSSSGLSRLWIDGELVIDNWSDQLPNINCLEPWISGEKRYTQYFNGDHEYVLMLEYSKNNQPNPVLSLGIRLPMKDQLLDEAVAAAKKADMVIVFAGYADGFEAEGFDRLSMRVPVDTEILLEKVLAANPNSVVVLQNGAPLVMDPWLDKAKAVLENWFAGQESANAIADVLSGKVNPSGKLAVTFPKRFKDSPGTLNYPGELDRVVYGEGIFVGYRYFDRRDFEPLFPFGHGLSYTTFNYKNLSVKVSAENAKVKLDIVFALTNSGPYAGKEVVQCYIGAPNTTVVRPQKELKAFQKIELQPGETAQIDLSIDLENLAYFDVTQKAWVTEAGLYQLYIGSSSRDIRLRDAFTIENQITRPVGNLKNMAGKKRLSMDSRLMDVLADPQGEKLLRLRFGDTLDHPQAKLVMRLSLKNIVQMAGDLIPTEEVTALEEDLRKLK